jgi:hypothetical protein
MTAISPKVEVSKLKLEKSLNPEAIKNFTQKCDLPVYSLLTPPDPKRENLEKWLKKPSRQGNSALTDFLSLNNGDQKNNRILAS